MSANLIQTIPVLKKVNPLSGYRLFLEFEDGVSGIVDLSHLHGKGVFEWWNHDENFSKVHIGSSGALVWNNDIDLDVLNCYLRIVNKTFEEYAGS
jgi:hypothetical protein